MSTSKSLLQLQKVLDAKANTYFTQNNHMAQRTTSSVTYIPVVVHIIHNGGPENISDAQVQTAIADINAKYLSSNNYQIQFCLAQRDPQLLEQPGITVHLRCGFLIAGGNLILTTTNPNQGWDGKIKEVRPNKIIMYGKLNLAISLKEIISIPER
jgi:hypothetical protein